jgi:hypothetical protein
MECRNPDWVIYDIFAKYQKALAYKETLRIVARTILADGDQLVLEDVVIRIDGLIMSAPRAVYDEATKQVRLAGIVRMMSVSEDVK